MTSSQKLKEEGMSNHHNNNKEVNPQKRFQDEPYSKGDESTDRSGEGQSQDLSTIERVISGDGQKMDTVHPDELEMDRNDRIIEEIRDNS